MKIAKYIALALAVVLGLLLVAAAYLALTFDPNEYKSTIVKMVQERTQRTLAIPGDIELSLFPTLGADLGRATISEKNSDETFAAIESAQVSLALMPLLTKEFVVDHLRIDGLRATIRRNRDGTTNVEDLTGDAGAANPETPETPETPSKPQTEEETGAPVAVNVGSIEIRNAHLTYDDQQQDRRVEIQGMNLQTGEIADRVPSDLQIEAAVKSTNPRLDARIAAQTRFTLYLEEQRYVLEELDAEVTGAFAGMTDAVLTAAGSADLKPADKHFTLDRFAATLSGQREGQPFEARLAVPQLAVTDASVTGAKLEGELRMSDGVRRVAATFEVPALDGSPQAFRMPELEVEATINDAELELRAKLAGALNGNLDKQVVTSPQMVLAFSGKQGGTPINGTLQTPVTVDLDQQAIEMPKLDAKIALPNPAGGGNMTLNAAGQAAAQLARETVNASLSGSLDQSAFKAKLGMRDFAAPAYNFDIGIERLDLDQYRQPEQAQDKATAQEVKPAPTSPVAAANAQTGAPADVAAGQDQPIDLSALRDLRATGSLRIGALKAEGLNATNVRVELRAAGGKLELNPLNASLYGGIANGVLTVAAANPQRYSLRQKLSGVNIGPLLKDALDNDRLEGRGDVQLDLSANGQTLEQIKRSLDGSAQIALRDGAVRGVNVAQALRTARSKVDALRGKDPVEQSGTGSDTEKTDFSELSGSFRITNGVARNDDLELKSPLIRLGGAGEINLVEGRLDYVARTTVVSSLQGQGGPELQALKGVTIPIRLTGPFDAIAWRVDVAAIVKELAKQQLGERKEELKAKAKKSLDEQKDKVQDRLKEELRGLFKR